MIEGKCLCGAVTYRIAKKPTFANACNCHACRRYGTLWAYGAEGEDITLEGEVKAFIRGDAALVGKAEISFNFCVNCGCLTAWRALETRAEDKRNIAVNLRLANPEDVSDIPVKHFDGFATWKHLPDDGRCVKDMWF
jgi:hypothetical protein